ncbi:hypothetical protein [Bauldia sp.]|uniref:hypothetical protein n=1 Tax=Bauldia sp. TaxID=2575872 RepID=UPI003BA9BA1C
MPTQSSDIYVPGGPAIEFSNPGQKWKIDKGVDVGSSGPAVLSLHMNNTLVNKGSIYSFNAYGAQFYKDNAKLVNKETGDIKGETFGVLFTPDDVTDTKGAAINDGEIFGGVGGIYNTAMGDFEVDNQGEIYGFTYGIFSQGALPGSTSGPIIKNGGSIKSDIYGVWVGAPDPSLRSKIVNQKDGVIKGGKIDEGGAAVFNTGKMTLVNKGMIKGDVNSPTVDKATITNTGKIKGDVYLGQGDDTLDNTDGEVTKKIFGFDGNDKLTAGDAKDKFVFMGPINGTSNIDRVKNFESGKDKFFLAEGAFGDLTAGPLAKSAFRKGTEAEDADDRIIYDQDSGKLYLDDGVGGSAPIQFAKVDPGQKLKYSDFTVELFV